MQLQYVKVHDYTLKFVPMPDPETAPMRKVRVTKKSFLKDRQGRTFSDVMDLPGRPFDTVVTFFDDANRQRRMEDSEIHHDRPPLAGVVRELEAHPDLHQFFAKQETRQSRRLRQAVGVLVRIIMEARGWVKTGRKGSMGVKASRGGQTAWHNKGGLALWFIRAERYERSEGMPYRPVRDRSEELNRIARASSKRKARAVGTKRRKTS